MKEKEVEMVECPVSDIFPPGSIKKKTQITVKAEKEQASADIVNRRKTK